ncbi:hypothetical protein K8T06_01425 [bacterium]|nr:hypothetical protein [bacterium]
MKISDKSSITAKYQVDGNNSSKSSEKTSFDRLIKNRLKVLTDDAGDRDLNEDKNTRLTSSICTIPFSSFELMSDKVSSHSAIVDTIIIFSVTTSNALDSANKNTLHNKKPIVFTIPGWGQVIMDGKITSSGIQISISLSQQLSDVLSRYIAVINSVISTRCNRRVRIKLNSNRTTKQWDANHHDENE